MRVLITALILWMPALSAQWLQYPTAGAPRGADGKPNLSAPAPKAANGKPDLSGMWQAADPLPCNDVTRICTDLPITLQFGNFADGLKDGLPYTQWARDAMKQRVGTDPYTHCITPGGPRMHLLPTMKKMVQTAPLLVILDEYNASFRQIFLDGRPLPEDPQPTWNGYSSGHWEGDRLIVESNGFRDDQWLDARGNPLTSAGKVMERFRRPNFGNMEIEITIDDPKAYTRPWTVLVKQTAVVDTDLLDSICLENEKDVPHLPGAR
ncbi:MAG TPA: hypothetical protein VKT49_01695 [Bryobacteraceae bacterium]|nr:hypothetical protein [Bryobacteraceae bacterium]